MIENPVNSRHALAEELESVNKSSGFATLEIQQWLVSKFAEVLGVDIEEVDASEQITNFGLGSVQLVSIVGELEDWLDLHLPGSLLWQYPSIEEVARALADGSAVQASEA